MNERNASVSPELFREAWRKFATGVSIVTTRQPDGGTYATTANSVASVSLDPLLVLVSFGKASSTHANLARERRFGINILRDDQAPIAQHYATSPPEERQNLPPAHRRPSGTTLLDDALACMDCRVVSDVGAGDHTVFIAEVEHIEVSEGAPLVFYDGRFGTVAEPKPEPAP